MSQTDPMRTNTLVAIIVAVVLAIAVGSYLVYTSKHKTVSSTKITTAAITPDTSTQNPDGPQVGGASMSSSLTVMDNIKKATTLATFTRALTLSGLNETLAQSGPFTVFAPTEKAFNALPQGSIDTLLQLQNKPKLVDILSYHIVPGSYKVSDLKDGQQLVTLSGKKLTVQVTSEGKTLINGAVIENSDIKTSNGMFDVVDTVLLPPS
jgi:uncharacterized surface protein with fasciclin (FAS1) repeats